MPGVILNATHVRRGVASLIGKDLQAARLQTMRDTAEFWHMSIFPRHFTGQNKTAYGMEQRNRVYLTQIKPREGSGTGRFTYEVLTGKSLRWAMSMYRITGTARRVTVRAQVPSYFTRPFVGSFRSPNGALKTITRQPNKPAEVTRFNERDKRDLREFAAKRFNDLIARALTKTITTQIG